MGQAIIITRTKHTAIALILEGRSRTEAAEQSGMDRLRER